MDGGGEKPEDADQSPMSKRQRKRLQKRELFVERRKIKRQERKERKKDQKRKLQEEKETADGQASVSCERDSVDVGLPWKKFKLMSSEHASSLRIAIDLSFDDLMTDRVMGKLWKQIQRTYSINRRAMHPVQLYLTSFGDRSKAKLDEIRCKYTSWDVHIRTESYSDVFSQEDVVYLCSDSPNVLTEVDETKAYIIGGLIDHNHHKGLCHRLAVERGIAHARLPISEYVKLNSRAVITVNQVFEIMLRFAQTKDWKKSFFEAIPARKLEGAIENKEVEKETEDIAQNGGTSEGESEDSDEGNDEQAS